MDRLIKLMDRGAIQIQVISSYNGKGKPTVHEYFRVDHLTYQEAREAILTFFKNHPASFVRLLETAFRDGVAQPRNGYITVGIHGFNEHHRYITP